MQHAHHNSGSSGRRIGAAVVRVTAARKAYTFVEILAVIAIIGILVALLLPAVQAAREAARRIHCSNNLCQLAIAAQQYEMAHGVYPPGSVDQQGPIKSLPLGYHHNWICQILPFLEQKNAYHHIDRNAGVYAAVNRPVRRLDLDTLRCPTWARQGRAYSDYAAMHSDFETPIDVDNNGSFFLNSRIGYQDLSDGSSNTLFFGEKATFIGDLGWMSGTRATLRNAGVPINWDPNRVRNSNAPRGYPPGIVDENGQEVDLPDEDEVLQMMFGPLGTWPGFQSAGTTGGWHWDSEYDEDYDSEYGMSSGLMEGEDVGMMGGTPSREERIPPFRRPTDAALAVGGFGSLHPGGAQFTLGGGSTRFLSETIDARVFWLLANRRDRRLGDTSDW